MCLFACLFRVCFYALTQVWKSEESFQGLIFSFCHMDSEDQTQAVRLSSKHLYPLSHLTSPQFLFVQEMSGYELDGTLESMLAFQVHIFPMLSHHKKLAPCQR